MTTSETDNTEKQEAVGVQVEPIVRFEFTQGVCEDGAAIFMDGERLTIEEILERLRCGICDEIDAIRYRKLRVKNWTERGITVVENSSSIKLGHMCLSHDRLDAALDMET
jgi:chromosome segregation and condensation protein ScpB